MFKRITTLCAALLILLAATDPTAALTVGFSTAGGAGVQNSVAFSPPGSNVFTSAFSTTAQGGSSNFSRSLAYDQQGHLNILFILQSGGDGFIERWDVTNQFLLSTNPVSNVGTTTNLAVGANGNLFFGTAVRDIGSPIQNLITEYNPLTGVSSSFVTADPSNPASTAQGAFRTVAGAAFDQQGHLNILFTPENASNGGFIERWDITNQTLLSTSFSFDGGARFGDMVTGPDGRLYFASRFDFADINRLNAFDPFANDPSLALVNFNTSQGLGGATGDLTGIAFDENGNLNVGLNPFDQSDLSFIETWNFANQTLQGTSPQGVINMFSLIADPVVVPEPGAAVLCLNIVGWLGMFGRRCARVAPSVGRK
jgi:hypothetical protein